MEIWFNEEDELQIYSLIFNHTQFACISTLNLSNLKYFSKKNQQKMGKMEIRFNISSLRQLPKNNQIKYILMTQYKQILSIVYLMRAKNTSTRIITTKSMFYSASVYADEFYRKIKKVNQVVNKPTFTQQSTIFDNYQIEFGINVENWVNIFTREELDQCFSSCIALNYGEIYRSETGNTITAYPSGKDIGSAVWLIQNCLTKQSLLWVQEIAHHNWRACKQFKIGEEIKKIDHLIFTPRTLKKQKIMQTQNKDQLKCQQFFTSLCQNLLKRQNIKIVLPNFLTLCDIVNVLYYKHHEKFRKIFITGLSARKMIAYANSYVQFLMENHSNRIYEDPPVYPFQSFQILKEKGLMVEGTSLNQICDALHIPMKELIGRYTPFINFEIDFHSYLEDDNPSTIQEIVNTYVDMNKLKKWFQICEVKQIYCLGLSYHQIPQLLFNLPSKTQILQNKKQYIIPSNSTNQYFIVEGDLSKIVSTFKKQNCWLKLKPYQSHFRLIQKNWMQILKQQVQKSQIQCRILQNQMIQTGRTTVSCQNNTIRIQSSCEKQLRVIDKIFEKMSKIIKLQ